LLALRAGDVFAMNSIDRLFQELRRERRKAFIPFVTAGDPDVAGTVQLIQEMARRGAHIIEIGFPYSDPIADGPVIQASYTRALERGLRLDDVFNIARLASERLNQPTPLVGMVSYSIVHRRGHGDFLAQAKQSGFSGLILPDLPAEEAAGLADQAAAHYLHLIQLVTPTTPRERAVQIAKLSKGFLYCVSITGITGERDRLPDELLSQLAWLRQHTDLPLCVGFGVSKPEHVRMLREAVDGVIVGSAIVRCVERAGEKRFVDVVREVGELAQSLIDALNPADV
jgi:tryptophan synthase alpha chain